MDRYRTVIKDVLEDVHLVEDPIGRWGLILESGMPFLVFETTPRPKPTEPGPELDEWYEYLHDFMGEFVMTPMMGRFLAEQFQPEGDETIAEWMFCLLADALAKRFREDSPLHVGFHSHRCVREPMEHAFATAWELWNTKERGHILRGLLKKKDTDFEGLTTRWEATTAATVIQWLGSPVGMSFLSEVTGIDIAKEMQKKGNKVRKGARKGAR